MSMARSEAPAPPLDLEAYLARLAYRGPLDATLPVLQGLQQAHLAAIPFEAIDAWVGDGVNLDPQAVEDKLVRRGRGGYCFEQNGLFRRVLARLGFAVEPRIARVLWGGGEDGAPQPRTHMTLRVTVAAEAWLVDVGFGAAVPPAPLRLESEAAQETPLGRYRLAPTDFGRRLEAELGGIWRPLYEVFAEPPLDVDFEVANWFTSRHPKSLFRRNLIVARATPKGRFSLRGAELTFRAPSGESRHEDLDATGLETALQEVFGLDVQPHWRPMLDELANRPRGSGDK
jgi:N-hydroxyarylamine O-acetyltransferase